MGDPKINGPDKDSWRTPPVFLEKLEHRFQVKFDLDPCAALDNHLGLKNFYTAADDGLTHAWPTKATAWVNSPFSNKWAWVRKAYLEAMSHDVDAWVLIENVTDTNGFHDWAPLARVYLLRGRISFLDANLNPLKNGRRGYAILRFSKAVKAGIELLDLDTPDWRLPGGRR